jgi:hypothetical protein
MAIWRDGQNTEKDRRTKQRKVYQIWLLKGERTGWDSSGQ